jgi:hypothetical protein
MRQYLRNALLMTLLVIVPALFITISYYTTRPAEIAILVTEGGHRQPISVWMPDLHGAIMVPIIAAFLAGIAGLFVMLDASRADGRLVVAGLTARQVGAARLLMILVFSVLVAVLSVSVTLVQSRPGDLPGFLLASLLVAVSYGFIGAMVVLLVGRLGGAYLMLFIPMIDVGIFQDPMMISGDQVWWMKLLPGFGGTRLAIDAAFTDRGNDWPALAAALVWVAGLAVLTLATFVRRTRR